MFSYISTKDWTEFERSFPDAASFLLEANLRGELRHERNIAEALAARNLTPDAYHVRRLAELEHWESTMAAIEASYGEGSPRRTPSKRKRASGKVAR